MPEGPAAGGARLTAGQMLGWGLAFLIIAALVATYFAHASAVAPLLAGSRS